MRKAKTDIGTVSDTALEDHVYLIRYASKLFSKRIRSPLLDYWDLYGEGVLLLTICLVKWGKKNDKEGFSRYFKTALFRRFHQLQTKLCKKEFLYSNSPIEEVLIGCDGGFGNIAFKELCNHVASELKQPDKTIFILFTDPPENLTKLILSEFKKREKHVADPNVKVRGKYLLKYLRSNGYSMTTVEFGRSLKRIRTRVKQILDEPRPCVFT
jgi:hypothetical protein